MQKLIFLAGVSLISLSITSGGMARNPQPEPPGKSRVMATGATVSASRMLNPQPLPPRIIAGQGGYR